MNASDELVEKFREIGYKPEHIELLGLDKATTLYDLRDWLYSTRKIWCELEQIFPPLHQAFRWTISSPSNIWNRQSSNCSWENPLSALTDALEHAVDMINNQKEK